LCICHKENDLRNSMASGVREDHKLSRYPNMNGKKIIINMNDYILNKSKIIRSKRPPTTTFILSLILIVSTSVAAFRTYLESFIINIDDCTAKVTLNKVYSDQIYFLREFTTIQKYYDLVSKCLCFAFNRWKCKYTRRTQSYNTFRVYETPFWQWWLNFSRI
jgi:hypothetical protein